MFSRKTANDSKRDWVDDATDTIERVVDGIRDKSVVPLTTAARAVVYGILAAFAGIAALALFTILLVRLLDTYLDYIPGISEQVWVAYLVTGAIFVIAGAFCHSKKRSPQHDEQ